MNTIQRSIKPKKTEISFTFDKTNGADVQRCIAIEEGVEIPTHRFIRDKVETGVFTITREEAETLLRYYNLGNRDTSTSYSKMYAAEFTAGDWKLNGEAIKFASKDSTSLAGRVLDGQNRLAGFIIACEASEAEEMPLPVFKTVVVMGLEDSAQKKMDRNFKRSIKNLFTLSNNAAVNNTAYSLASRISKCLKMNEVKGLVSDRDIASVFDKHGNSINYVASKMVNGVNGTKNMSVNVCLCLYHTVNPESAENFITRFSSGEGLTKNDPVLLLRDYVQQGRGQGGNSQKMIESMGKSATAIICHRNNKPAKHLRVYKAAHKNMTWLDDVTPIENTD